ncbi:MAG: alpha/beta hydrolase [Chloroflexi bacterium]|nr:alpha/beta hydrolase [Chloroflexota bacterium]
MASPAQTFDREGFMRDAGVQQREADAKSEALRREFRHELNVSYGPHEKQYLDIYYPKQPAQNARVVAFVHGAGGYVNHPARFGFVGRALLERGVMFVVLGGRRMPDLPFPDSCDDIEDGLAWIADHIREHGGDPDKIYLAGESFGAMESADVAFRQELIRHGLAPFTIKGVILFGGGYMAEAMDGANKDSPRYLPNLRQVLPHLPPHAIVVAGTREQLPRSLPEARALVAAVEERGGSAELIELEGVDHFHTIDSLADPNGLVFKAVARMIGL